MAPKDEDPDEDPVLAARESVMQLGITELEKKLEVLKKQGLNQHDPQLDDLRKFVMRLGTQMVAGWPPGDW